MRNKLHIDTAIVYKNYSTCARLQVGAVLVNGRTGRVLSAGYNGTPSGMENCNSLFKSFVNNQDPTKHYYTIDFKVFSNYGIKLREEDQNKFNIGLNYSTEDYQLWKYYHGQFSQLWEIHSEQNAILSAFKDGTNCAIEDMILVITTAPCYNCCKLISASGIKKVVYIDPYDRTDINEVKKLLETLGVKLIQARDWENMAAF